MVSQSLNGAYSDGGSQVSWEDGERVVRRGWRLESDGNRRAVLIVVSAAQHPSRSILDRLAHEYELKDQLDGAWAVRPLDLVRDANRTALVLEDVDGEPLDRLIGAPMEMGRFLDLAIVMAAAVGKLHQRSIVHKDIKPANFLVNVASGEVRLTGFGIASRLARERQSPHPPETIAGTLAYMAPEQTGRMNRSIDSRSDLYALGVTFYQMLTGALPFAAADPMEWVHCHLARRPVTPAARVREIPGVLSAIVIKLLAKMAEDRYQTATGLESDLRLCQSEWRAKRWVDAFPLGEHDTPDRLLIPEKLYGRQREVEALLDAFDRVVNGGAPELVLVSGYSGIGKSSVVNELQPVLVPPRGLFASGKFDQYKRDIPYSTLAQAFQGLIRPLLGKSEADLAPWRDALWEALGPNAGLIVDLVPEVRLIVGEPPPIPEVSPQDAQRRFQLVFRQFIGVFARPEHPLALFLDDLQWLDAATLDLLEDLLSRSDLRNLLLIGAYRDNEVGANHPLLRKLEAIRSAGAKVNEIVLGPLVREHVGQLLADTLRCEPERSAPLAQLVQEKTGGNPFFTIQFIASLAEEGMLAFDHDGACWSWDLDRIHDKGFTDNVVDLIVGNIDRLPSQTQTALQQLACIGNLAETTTLSIALEMSQEQVDAALWESVRQGLVEQLDGSYRFIHDRVREAAYSLVPEASRPKAHLRIGRLLATRSPPEKQEESAFVIVNHLNRGAALITSREERERLAELNLIAGKRAKASAAYASALQYLDAGSTLLGDDCWERRHDLTFALELARAECEFLTGELGAADARLSALSNRTANILERAALTCLFLDVGLERLEIDRAISVALDYLRHVGIEWSAHPADEGVRREYERIWSQLGDRTIEELADLPLMTDAESLATMDVLLKTGIPAAFWDDNLNCLTVCRAVNLSLERGNCDASCVVYCSLAWIAIRHFRDYKTALRFGQVGLKLIEERGLRRFEARARTFFGDFIAPWVNHIRVAIDVMRQAFDAASKIGDFTFVNYANFKLSTHLLIAGAPLSEVQREALLGLTFGGKARAAGDIVEIPRLGLIRSLRGLTPKFGSLDGQEMDELQFERVLAGNPHLRIHECWYWIRKMMARYFAGDFPAAMEASSNAQRLVSFTVSQIDEAEYHFFSALSRAASCDSATADERQQHLSALAAHHRQFEMWAENCPENFENRAALLGAEIARIEGRELDAERLYEAAIKSARKNEFVHNEAIANELAARFHSTRGFETIANAYLREARFCYLHWGADGKVRQLEQLHPWLRQEERSPGQTGTIEAPVEQLDLATVIDVSQALSGEMDLGKLIHKLMRAAIENAGADRGLLIRPQGEEVQIDAEATARGDDVAVQVLEAGARIEVALPEALVRYAIRTRETVILDDASSSQNSFSADPYFAERRARSILCLPLINQGKLIGVLYLENNLAPRVFTRERITVLKVLASQAATSIENSRLYRDLKASEAEFRRAHTHLSEAQRLSETGSFTWDVLADDHTWTVETYRIFGFKLGAKITMPLIQAAIHPEDMQAVATVIGGAAEGADFDLVFRIVTPSGVVKHAHVVGHRSQNITDRPVFVGAIQDVTESKIAEEALRASERNARLIVDSIPGLVGVLGPKGDVEAVNRQILEYCGQSLEELKSWGTNGTIHTEDVPHVVEAIARSTASSGPYHFEARMRRYDGEYRWFDARGIPVRDTLGRIARWYALLTDIEDRTRALARLQQTQSDFARMNRVSMMGELAASLSHEITQPIASARNNARAALNFLDKQSPDLGEVREALGCVVGDADRAGDIIGRIRDQIRKAPPRKDHFDLNAAVAEVIALARSAIIRAGVSVQTRLTNQLPPVHGDRVQLQQVVLNLILNAVEALGSVEVGVRELLISTEQVHTGVLVAVSDSGSGIDPTLLDRVFEAFYTTKSSGTGMGLSICRSIIDAHGGRLWVEANEPCGAVFQFTLPGDSLHATEH